MSFIHWREELLTGIGSIDTQHRWLVDTTNRLHEEVNKSSPDRTRAGEILAGLVGYTLKHFTMEEELFARHGYNDSEAHIEQHNIFREQIMLFLARHNTGDVVSPETLDVLKLWLIEHIMKTDKSYVQFFREKRVV
jgi:hemerythrin